MIRFVHFSDFHLQPDERGQRSMDILDRMIDTLQEIQQEYPINAVVFSGDLINQGGNGFGKTLYECFKLFETQVIQKIVNDLNIQPEQFLFVAGNHDVDRTQINKRQNTKIRKDLNNQQKIDNYLTDAKSDFSRIEDFCKFQKEYYGTNDAEDRISSLARTVCLQSGNCKIGVALLNTSWLCYDNDRNNIALGKAQITRTFQKLKKENCNLYIAVAHHHYSFLKEFEQPDVKNLLFQHFDIFFCGHTHGSDTEYKQGVYGNLFESVAAGSLYNNIYQTDAQYKNGFAIIDYETDTKTISVTPYWQQNDESFDVDLNYGSQGTKIFDIPGRKFFKPLNEWLQESRPKEGWIQSEMLNQYKATLQNLQNKRLVLTAISGLGKTRLIYEALYEIKGTIKKGYYIELRTQDINTVLLEFQNIVKEIGREDGLIVIDNCKWEDTERFNAYCSKNIRLICINNECYSRPTVNDFNIVRMSADDLRDEVNKYIESQLPLSEHNHHICNEIKKLSDGFPYMAISLLGAYHEVGNFSVNNVGDTVFKMLNLKPENAEQQKAVLTMMSLFQPFPCITYNREAYDFIVTNELFLPLDPLKYQQRKRVINETLSEYKNSLLEDTGSMINVRPYPLAVYLVSEWFKGLDATDIKDLIEQFEALSQKSPATHSVLVDSMAMRLEYMRNIPLADELIERLTGNTSPFVSEKVAFSEMGSRLFLAMVSVNPTAVCNCLSEILNTCTDEQLQTVVAGKCRRNYVMALEKLCFNKDTYKDASLMMARLALAENERWANNATGQFLQLFHILLAGTEANLDDRFQTIDTISRWGPKSADLVFAAIDQAFTSRDFVRSGGGEYFASEEKKDHVPTRGEVWQYWNRCHELLLKLMEANEKYCQKAMGIAEHHCWHWIYEGYYSTFFVPLVDALRKHHADTTALYDTLSSRGLDALVKHIPAPNQQEAREYIQSLSSGSFMTKLKEANLQMYDKRDCDTFEDMMAYFEPLAKEFIQQQVYANEKELAELAEKKNTVYPAFLRKVSDLMSDEELDSLFVHLLPIVLAGCDAETIPFVSSLCSINKTAPALEKFLSALLHQGRVELYIRYMAKSEDEALSRINTLISLEQEGKIKEGDLSCYLSEIAWATNESLAYLIQHLCTSYPTLVADVMDCVLRFRYGFKRDDEKLMGCIKQLTLQYPITDDDNRNHFEYFRYVCRLLESAHDEEFAKAINKKLLDVLNAQVEIPTSIYDVFPVLVTKYTDVIWDDFSKEFAKDFSYTLFLLKDEIGSGFGFSKGPLFQIDSTRIKALCEKYPETAPTKIALMMPVFDTNYNEATSFSSIALWLLGHYGNNQDVLDEFHANIHSYSLVGSPLPLFMQQKKCFEQLQNHALQEVRIWSTKCIQELDHDIKREQDSEDFRRMHYM